jgi:transposase-like protein
LSLYTEEFKKEAVRKSLSRGNRTLQEISRELGVSVLSIYAWKKKYATNSSMRDQKSPQDRSSLEKFTAVIEYDALNESERGEFLRKNGFHTEHIELWRNQMKQGLEPVKMTKEERSEMASLNREVRELKKELARKDKALAETAALLILKKKANLLFGLKEDE